MQSIDYLIAYPYLNKSTIDACVQAQENGHKLWIDSGAFTTYKAKKPPTPVSEFIAFVRAFPIQPERVFTLDVVGDAAATKVNHERLVDAGLNVVPIATPGTPLSELEMMYKHSDLIAVGGINTHKGSGGGGTGWAKHVLTNNNKHVHLLGCLNKSLIARYRPYSVDAASWEYGALTGTLSLYLGRGRAVTIKRTDMAGAITDEQTAAIRSYGYDLKDLRKEASWRGQSGLHFVLGAQSMIRFAMDCRKQFDTRVVLSLVNGHLLDVVQRAFAIEKELERAR